MSDPVFKPTYLRQGSCLMVFSTPEAASQAHSACVAAFYNREPFAGFTLRPPLNPLPDWMRNGQPCQPWLVLKHRCIIFGITGLAENSAHYPGGVDEVIIHNDPPILLGNHALFFDLVTIRNTQVTKTMLAEYNQQSAELKDRAAAEVIEFPLQVQAVA